MEKVLGTAGAWREGKEVMQGFFQVGGGQGAGPVQRPGRESGKRPREGGSFLILEVFSKPFLYVLDIKKNYWVRKVYIVLDNMLDVC